MNRDVDYAIGRYVIMHVTDDGLSRIQGHKTYENWQAAERGIEALLRGEWFGNRLTVLRIEGDFWLDPKPAMLSNIPAPDQAA